MTSTMEGNGATIADLGTLAATAESAFESGDWATAVGAFEVLVGRHPEQADLKYQLAHAYEEAGRVQDAIALLTDPSIAGLEKSKRRLAKTYIGAKNYEAAMPLVDELVAISPGNSKFAKWKALCVAKSSDEARIGRQLQRGVDLVAADRLDEAARVCLDLLAEFPHAGRAYSHLGQIYAQQKRWAEAIPHLKAALNIDPDNMKLRISLARALFKNGEPAETIAILNGTDGSEKEVDALFLLQRSYMELHDHPRVDRVGARLLKLVSTKDPLYGEVSALREAALIERDLANLDATASSDRVNAAIKGYKDLVRRHPESPTAWIRLGTLLADAGEIEDAVGVLRQAARVHPHYAEARQALTKAIIRSSEEQEILRYVEDLVGTGAADFESLRWLARYHADRSNWAASLESANQATAIDPGNISTRLLLARALMQLGRLPEALDELKETLGAGAKQAEALQLKADIFMRLARFEEAIQLYREALAVAPKDPLIGFKLSSALLMIGDIEGFHRFHEKRRELASFVESERARTLETWEGELWIEGKLLVWAEPGLGVGQNILHMTFLKQLAALGLDVVFEVDPSLVEICRRSFPDITIVASDAPLPAGITHQTPIASLLRWFKPDLGSFDLMPPYIIPDVQAVAAHRARLQRAAGEGHLLVGISWATNAPPDVAGNPIQLDQLLGAIALPGVTLVNLQDGDHSHANALAETTTGKRLVDSGVDNGDLDALAALVAAMDLVVSVDHATAHIAGAIGTPTYVLLPAVPAPYWLAQGNRAIWYPATILLRRGPEDEGWDAVLEELQSAVRDFVKGYEPDAWLTGTSVPGLRPFSAGAGTMCPSEIGDAVRAHVAQDVFVQSAQGSARDLSAAPQLCTLDDLPIAVDPEAIDAAMHPFLVSEVDDERWNKWHAKVWHHVVDRLVSGREVNRDRGLIERDYAVWATMGYERYRIGRKTLHGTPWTWRGRRLSLDGAAAARIRTVLFSAVIDQLRPRRVLEVGSGHGINLLSLAGAYPEIEFTGLELTHEGVEQARSAQSDCATAQIVHAYSPVEVVQPSAIERIRFVQGDASAMPFDAGSFDLVMTVLAVEQMESIRSAALAEISRVTSGHVLMLEPFRDMNEHGLRRLYVQSRGYFRGAIRELRNFGLEPLWATGDFPQETFLGTAFVLAIKQSA